MRYGKKRSFDAPYETLSDIAIGSLGVFVILVVVLVIISTLHSTGVSNVFHKIKNENDYYESEIINARNESEEYKSNDYAKKEIRQLRREYDKTKRKLDRIRVRLDLEKEKLHNNKAKFEEVTSVLDVIKQKRKEHTDFVVEMNKLIELKYLFDKNTGYGVDKTGSVYMNYYTYTPSYYSSFKDTLFLIGNQPFSINQFRAFLNSNRFKGKSGLTIKYHSPYICKRIKEHKCNRNYYKYSDNIRPEWARHIIIDIEGWSPIKLEEK